MVSKQRTRRYQGFFKSRSGDAAQNRRRKALGRDLQREYRGRVTKKFRVTQNTVYYPDKEKKDGY